MGFRVKYFDKISKKVRQRDNYICQKCNKPETKEETHDVHHIIPKRISKDDSLENLITLCKSCHKKEDNKYLRFGITKYVRDLQKKAKHNENEVKQ